jgi:polysaccharide deacetylase 2 family uncharacterized protein YibQ
VADDLSAPLGQGTKRKRWKLPPITAKVITGVLGLCLAVFVLWAAVVQDPMGGEPGAVVAVPDMRAAAKSDSDKAESAVDQKASADREPAVVPAPAGAPGAGGTQTVTIIDGSSGKAQEVQVPAADGARTAAVDAKLLETSRHGQIPRIGIDGARALTAYARASGIPAGKESLPRIALVLGGLGISAASTSEAMSKLPGPVTFAFAPYGTDIVRLGGRARAEGHELLLQIPMEPFDYPDNDPGPQTLLTTLAPEQNVDRAQWLMSRMQGYVGIVNYMGARFTATEAALAPVLRETSKRGLLYLDDGASPRSLAGQIAGANNLPFAKVDVVLDSVPTPTEIDRALLSLETLARENGVAVGFANALPVAIDRLAKWAKTAVDRGFLLVPISTVAVKPKSAT